MIKKLIKSFWRATAPKSYWSRRLTRLRSHRNEQELMLCGILAQKGRMAVDVGAARGVFAVHLLPYASKVLAFEPRPKLASELREMARVLKLPISVESVALSDASGRATLRMPVRELGRSTIDAANLLEDSRLGTQESIEVPIRRLDDYELTDVGFVKIDVEGHELAALAGAQETLSRNGCRLLVEAEDRHHAGASTAVIRWMEERGFVGYFLVDKVLHPSTRFQRHIHQNEENIDGSLRRGIYVNNFIFVPRGQATEFVRGCLDLGVTIAT